MKERLSYIDALRGFAIIMVVLGHFYTRNGYENSILTTIIYSFHMPLFFFISGFVAGYAYNPLNSFNMVCKYIWKKTYAIMLPYFVWCVLVRPFCFQNPIISIHNISSDGIMSIFLPEYWYLPCLYTLSIFLLIYKCLLNAFSRKTIFISSLLLFILGTICIIPYYFFANVTLCKHVVSYFLPFFLGVLFSENYHFALKISSNKILVFVSICLFSFFNGVYFEYHGQGLIAQISRLLCGISSIVVLIALFQRYDFNSLFGRQLQILGKNTLGIYLMHFIFVNDIGVPQGLSTTSLILVGVGMTLLLILICLPIIILLNKNSICSFLLFGKR